MRHSNVSGSRGYRLETVLVWKSGAGRFNTVVGITRAVRWASRVHVFMMSSILLSGRGLRWTLVVSKTDVASKWTAPDGKVFAQIFQWWKVGTASRRPYLGLVLIAQEKHQVSPQVTTKTKGRFFRRGFRFVGQEQESGGYLGLLIGHTVI